MSIDNKTLLGVALLAGVYFYMNKGQPAQAQTGRGGIMRPSTMPGSAGTGLNQVEAGAITGFLKAVTSGIRNNSESGYPYYSESGNGTNNGGGIAQSLPVMQDNVWAGDDPNIWTVGGNDVIDAYDYGDMAYA